MIPHIIFSGREVSFLVKSLASTIMSVINQIATTIRYPLRSEVKKSSMY